MVAVGRVHYFCGIWIVAGGRVHYFCETWRGYLMRPSPPEKMAGVVLGAVLLCAGSGRCAPGRIAGMLAVHAMKFCGVTC